MKTYAEALAENEFYARARAQPPVVPAAPVGLTRAERAKARVAEKWALLSGFNGRLGNFGPEGVMRVKHVGGAQ